MIFNVGVRLGVRVEPEVIDGEVIAQAIGDVYGRFAEAAGAATRMPTSW